MSAPAELRRTQRWFLGEVTRASALPHPRAGRRRVRAAAVVEPSPTLDPDERVAIYGRMYIARLEECLTNDFPVVHELLGCKRFARVTRRYVTRHPPSSWTLNVLGATLPAFLRKLPGLPRAALVRDVAQVERSMSEAFDAEETRALSPADVAAIPAKAWARARLIPAPSLRLHALETRASLVITSVREKKGVPRPLPRGPSWTAVYRKDDRVWRLELTQAMHAALSRLARGQTLGAALQAASRVHEGDAAELADLVRGWFAVWVAEGLFAGVAL